MNFTTLFRTFKPHFLVFTFCISIQFNGQTKSKNNFWEKVQFGGGIGLNIGNDYTNITLAPSAIYNFNSQFSLGSGIQYSYLKQNNSYTSNLIGVSLIGLYNPIETIQLSLELEEMNVSQKYESLSQTFKDNFWLTSLFAGAGYRTQNVTIGARYNLLFNKDKNVYGEAFMPFVRVYF